MTLSAGPLIAPPPPRRGPWARARGAGGRSLDVYLPAIVVLVVAFLVLEFGLAAIHVESFLLPRPSTVATALQVNWSSGRFAMLPSALATLQEALTGLVVGTLAGLAVAFASARWLSARSILLPLAVAANAVPIIAFAPLLNNWFGLTNPLSKSLMAAVLVFFPVMANVTRGLVQVEPGSVELMRSYAASEWTILRKVRIPNALPYFFTAMKVATTLSLIGAIVGEYFGGLSTVLGRVIVQSASALKFDVTWAAILLGAATGIVFYLIVSLAERLVIPWAAALRGEG